MVPLGNLPPAQKRLVGCVELIETYSKRIVIAGQIVRRLRYFTREKEVDFSAIKRKRGLTYARTHEETELENLRGETLATLRERMRVITQCGRVRTAR